jgi:hypothetical protein
MADNVYFNCNLFMELLDRHAQLQQKFSRTNEELFNDMGSSFAAATQQLASSPLTMESAQALMMCWNAIRTFRQEQQLLADCADRIIAYLAQMKPSSSFSFVQPQPVQEKPKRGGGKEKAKRSYTPRGAAKQQQQKMAQDFLKEEEKLAKEDLRQLVEHLNAERVSPPPENEGQQANGDPASPKAQFVFDADQDGSQVPDW